MLVVLCVLVVAVCSPHLADGSTKMKRDQDVFTAPQIPEDCKQKGYCESVPDYPTEFVINLVDESGNSSEIYQMDELDAEVQVAMRLGDSGSNKINELCDATEKIMMLELGEDKDGYWHTVINPPGKPYQGFRTEICNGGGSCSPLASIQQGYTASCKQKFAYRTMFIVNEDGKLEQKSLKLPTCCICAVTDS